LEHGNPGRLGLAMRDRAITLQLARSSRSIRTPERSNGIISSPRTMRSRLGLDQIPVADIDWQGVRGK
jgi:hypothetical protein